MRLNKLLTVATFCVLGLASTVLAHHEDRCLDPGRWNGGIQVINALYGANCGVYSDVSWYVQDACEGHQTCWYRVDHRVIGDPAYGCPKDFKVNYSCGDFQTRVAYLHGEASGHTLMLSCN